MDFYKTNPSLRQRLSSISITLACYFHRLSDTLLLPFIWISLWSCNHSRVECFGVLLAITSTRLNISERIELSPPQGFGFRSLRARRHAVYWLPWDICCKLYSFQGAITSINTQTIDMASFAQLIQTSYDFSRLYMTQLQSIHLITLSCYITLYRYMHLKGRPYIRGVGGCDTPWEKSQMAIWYEMLRQSAKSFLGSFESVMKSSVGKPN